MACSVCQAPPGNEHSFVHVGRLDCPNGFTADYNGMLLTSHTSHYGTEYICVDANPEPYGSNLPDTAAYLYLTETENSFANYPNFYEMGCAHCTSVSSKEGGSVFVNYGRTDCPANSSLLYTSQLGGTHYTQSGMVSTLFLYQVRCSSGIFCRFWCSVLVPSQPARQQRPH